MDALVALRGTALRTAPWAFGSSPGDDRITPAFAASILAAEQGQAVLGAFGGGALVGMVGLVRPERAKRAHLAQIWGMFVQPGARGRGLGRALLQAAIDEAQAWGVQRVALSVTSAARAAQRLYASAGFEVWGQEPDALLVDGQLLDELHLTLALAPEGAG